MGTSKQHWNKHIKAWQTSGQTQAAYCRKHGLNAKSFSRHLSDYNKQETTIPARLIPVEVKANDQQPLSPILLSTKDYHLELPLTVSGVIQEIGSVIGQYILSLLAFNIGVELG